MKYGGRQLVLVVCLIGLGFFAGELVLSHSHAREVPPANTGNAVRATRRISIGETIPVAALRNPAAQKAGPPDPVTQKNAATAAEAAARAAGKDATSSRKAPRQPGLM